jgi:alpha-amylase
MFRALLLRTAGLVIGVLVFVGCASGGSPADVRPTAAPTTIAQTNAGALETVLAVPTAAKPTPNLPTPVPTITVGPTVAPFPLPAGWWDNAVCYEVFVRSFYDSDGNGIGDINGLIQKLDYINDGDPATQSDLGANCIWLMPITDSPSYHGYDTTDYGKVEPDYGSNDDFKRLVGAAHQRGIKVILDLVLNHTARDHPWFQSALKGPGAPERDWYLWSNDKPSYKTPWGTEAWHPAAARDEYFYGIFWEGMPDLNYRNPAVTAEAHTISAFWLNDMGVDGFRLDAIKHLIENGPVQEHTPETHAWLRDYRAFLEKTKPGTFTVGEIFGANPPTLAPYYSDQLDAYFVFEIGYQIINAANSGRADAFVRAVQNTDQLPFQRWAPFLTNHDQERAMSTFGNDTGKAKIAATALLTLPGMPFLYYGEEIGMLGTKPDEQIRTPMQWSGDDTGGFSTGRPWAAFQQNYQQVNVAAQEADPASLLNLYRRLIHLHTEHPALAHGSFAPLKASAPAVAAFLRQADDELVLVVLNFGQAAVDGATLELATGGLAPGTYQLTPLLGNQPGADLIVDAGGSVAGYTPLATLAPQTGYVFKLMQ